MKLTGPKVARCCDMQTRHSVTQIHWNKTEISTARSFLRLTFWSFLHPYFSRIKHCLRLISPCYLNPSSQRRVNQGINNTSKKKCIYKVFTVHAMKAYTGSRGLAPLIPNLGTIWRSEVIFMPWPLYPWDETSVPVEQEAVWAPERVRTFLGKKFLAPTSIRTPNHSSNQQPSTPARLLLKDGC